MYTNTMSILAQIFIAPFAIIFIYIFTRWLLRRAVVHASHEVQLSSSSRRLGKFEESLEIFSNERQGTTNSCYVMTLHSKKELKESLVRAALIRVAKRQPMLRAIVKIVSNFSWFGQNNERYFEIIEPNKIGDMIDLTNSDVNASQWEKAWYDTAVSPIKSAGLLWRAILFAEEYLPDSENYVNTIIFRVNHCIIDGVSGMDLCKQFLRHLNNVAENTPGEDVPSHELFPSLYTMISNTRTRSSWKDLQEYAGLPFIYKFIIRLGLRIFLAFKPEKPYPFFMTRPSTAVRDLMYKEFPETITSQIRNACKSKGVTVTGALMAAAHKAFCQLMRNQDTGPKEQEKLMHMFAFSGVQFCEPKPPAEYLGNFVMADMFPISCNVDFWSMAEEATKQMRALSKEGKDLTTFLAQLDQFTPQEFVNEFHSPLDPKKQLLLFNIHNNFSSAGAFTCDDSTYMYKLHKSLYYAIPFGFIGFAFHCNTTVNGKMSWVIICSKFVPSTIEEQFAELCFNIIQKETEQK